MQVGQRVFDVMVLVLACAAFCREHAAAVDIVEIPVGKFVMSFGLFGLFVVESQIPLAVFGKTVEADECIFLLCGRPMFAPRSSLVQDDPSFVDELLGMLICPAVERHGHEYLLLKFLPIAPCIQDHRTEQGGQRRDGNQFPDRFFRWPICRRDEPFLDERQCEVRARPVQSGPCRVERPDLVEDWAIDVYGNEELEVV